MTKQDQLKGAIYGLLVGDAVGVSYEFLLAEQLPAYDQIEMLPPNNFAKTYPHIPVGTWSDDGAQALCLLDSLLYKNKMDTEDFMKRICNWYQCGYMAVDFQVFDVGVQTAEAIRNYLSGVPLLQVANNDVLANGNGSLMRVLPLAIWHQGSDIQLIEDAYAQSHVTHAHLRSKVCCALYCLWARSILNGLDIAAAWSDAVTKLRAYLKDKPDDLEQLEYYIRPDELEKGTGSGYVVDCLKSARYALKQTTYQDVIKTAIAFGRDTDTTACVAGGIAGLYFGFDSIPESWLAQLRAKDLVEPLLTKLLSNVPA
ncbi:MULTISPECIES: ADP-ribosylglycohydrolase family protein [Acinetobacter]|uniref:ADP-ribosylglycohydrolase family protein n=1 Tax=Acinetobacter TaxID=469 RepID=UPI0003C117E2|nr:MULTISPECIES: ADP-ribosylglycohydrolase family protein [unclassified Acinetobacter]KEC84748.1 crystallin [Acinetobacter sp. ETR1]UOH17019.1 ADP-ribosylglycohydrolase family protein [Acinetobacter sp. NyZ410]WEE41152.1 ADP-ribosylglycohydrolase family protein [Acinetobacter sp. TAC-1]